MLHANEGERKREGDFFFYQNVCKIKRIGKCRAHKTCALTRNIGRGRLRDLRDFSVRLNGGSIAAVKGKGTERFVKYSDGVRFVRVTEYTKYRVSLFTILRCNDVTIMGSHIRAKM